MAISARPLYPYSAVLVASYGGPEKPEDVLPFMRNATAGRGVPDERLVEVSQQLRLRQTSSHGLLGNDATTTVAALLGVCDRTVRRRFRRTIRALTEAAPAFSRAA